jgi:hypothetical protein
MSSFGHGFCFIILVCVRVAETEEQDVRYQVFISVSKIKGGMVLENSRFDEANL